MSKIIEHKKFPGQYIFKCPGCNRYHFPTSQAYTGPLPKWDFIGTIDNPTFSPSFLHAYGEKDICHYFIKDGNIEFCGDSTHKLRSQTVPLPECDIPEVYYS